MHTKIKQNKSNKHNHHRHHQKVATKQPEQKRDEIVLRTDQLMPASTNDRKILQERADRIAILKEPLAEMINEISYIRFRLAKHELYGINYDYANEVIHQAIVTKLPYLPDYVAGVINHRGLMLTVIDLNRFLKLANNLNDGINLDDEESNNYIIITKCKNFTIGFQVNDIDGSDKYELNKLESTLEPASNIKPDYILGVHKAKTSILNIEAIVSDINSLLATTK